jgi:hypothetical protein
MTSTQHQQSTAPGAGDPHQRPPTDNGDPPVDDKPTVSAPRTTLHAPWYSILGPTPHWRTAPTPNIADQFADLLGPLDDRKRRGMISWIAVRFYEGWRPGRDEIADLVAVELGTLSLTDCIERQRHREHPQHQQQRARDGQRVVTDITALSRGRAGTAGPAEYRLGPPRRTARWATERT